MNRAGPSGVRNAPRSGRTSGIGPLGALERASKKNFHVAENMSAKPRFSPGPRDTLAGSPSPSAEFENRV